MDVEDDKMEVEDKVAMKADGVNVDEVDVEDEKV